MTTSHNTHTHTNSAADTHMGRMNRTHCKFTLFYGDCIAFAPAQTSGRGRACVLGCFRLAASSFVCSHDFWGHAAPSSSCVHCTFTNTYSHSHTHMHVHAAHTIDDAAQEHKRHDVVDDVFCAVSKDVCFHLCGVHTKLHRRGFKLRTPAMRGGDWR